MAYLVHDKLLRVEEIISYRFNDRTGLQLALDLSSGYQEPRNGLAMLGDKVIDLVLVSEGLRRGETLQTIDGIRRDRACNKYFNQQGFAKGLDECIIKNPAQRGIIPPGPMATTVEAVIGAVFDDSSGSLDAAMEVMERLGVTFA